MKLISALLCIGMAFSVGCTPEDPVSGDNGGEDTGQLPGGGDNTGGENGGGNNTGGGNGGGNTGGDDKPDVYVPDVNKTVKFEVSYWMDMDCIGSHLRGYWLDPATTGKDSETPEAFVKNSVHQLAATYKANKLYVIYHRQYEIDAAKRVFGYWKKYGDENGVMIVPTIVTQNYQGGKESLNFTDAELEELCRWCMTNICAGEVGIYDVYTRDQAGKPQDVQLNALSQKLGNIFVRVGMQPGVSLRPYYKYAVQDTWTAECQGLTNSLWESPVSWNGTNNYGKNLLVNWVNERVNASTELRKWVWNLIPVAWDYDAAGLVNNPYSYACPGDDAATNDPPISGRLVLCEKYITLCYTGGYTNSRFGGYSCDLHILQANSAGCGKDTLPFYKALREDKKYTGYFGNAMDEIAAIYQRITLKTN